MCLNMLYFHRLKHAFLITEMSQNKWQMIQCVTSIKLAINIYDVQKGLVVVRFPSPPLDEELFNSDY